MKIIKSAYASLSRLPMIIVAGVFLALSLLNLFFKLFPVDPAWVTLLICGTPLVVLALQRILRQFFISSALLISIAMFASIYIGEIFAAGEVAFIMALGAWLEDRTVEKAKRGLEGLLKLVPDQARRISAGPEGPVGEEIVDVSVLKPGDVVRILPGETIVADGRILSGDSSVDQSVLTGESLPVDKAAGDEVFTGTLNCFGSIDVEVTKALADSSLRRMVALAREAENKQAPLQKIVDRWAQWLVPIACLIAVAGYFITKDLTRAVTVLVVFCPCALALATPVSIVAAIGQATKFGVIVKSGEALEKMGRVSVIAFDKTGTLTLGKLTVTDVAAFSRERDELLSLAAACESRSEHPIGRAVTAYAREEGIGAFEVTGFTMSIGKGVYGTVRNKTVLCGNERLLGDFGVWLDDSAREAVGGFRKQGKAVVIVAEGDAVAGVLALSDLLRENAKEAVAGLEAAGIRRAVLLTGDNEETAKYIASQSGISEVYASLLPEDKARIVSRLEAGGEAVCMIGDGINDAAALKTASVGVAMGSMGSDIAVDASDIALMGDDISKAAYVKRLSGAAIRNIKTNISLSMAINAAAIALSLLGALNPITGALVHNMGSVLVVMNAARLYNKTV